MNSKIEYIVTINREFDFSEEKREQSTEEMFIFEDKLDQILGQFPTKLINPNLSWIINDDISRLEYEFRIIATSENDFEELLIDLNANYEIEGIGAVDQ